MKGDEEIPVALARSRRGAFPRFLPRQKILQKLTPHLTGSRDSGPHTARLDAVRGDTPRTGDT